MLKPNEFVSVQPENRTLIEEGLEFAWHGLLSASENPYPELKQPLLTSDEFVSLLASERGVLDWQPNDTMKQRRETTEQAFAIHRKAGTRFGLSQALSVLNITTEMKKGALAYSLKIDGYLSDLPIDKETTARVASRIDNYKSERDTVDIALIRSADSHAFIGSTIQTGIVIEIGAA